MSCAPGQSRPDELRALVASPVTADRGARYLHPRRASASAIASIRPRIRVCGFLDLTPAYRRTAPLLRPPPCPRFLPRPPVSAPSLPIAPRRREPLPRDWRIGSTCPIALPSALACLNTTIRRAVISPRAAERSWSNICSSDAHRSSMSASETVGDTLRLGAKRIRLHGIDAPQSAQR